MKRNAKKIMHTKTPWKAHEIYPDEIGGNRITYAIGRAWGSTCKNEIDICRVFGKSDVRKTRANSNFIIRACNSHDALVNALKTARDAFLFGFKDGTIDYKYNYLIEEIRHAINLSKEDNYENSHY